MRIRIHNIGINFKYNKISMSKRADTVSDSDPVLDPDQKVLDVDPDSAK
jgi:hypothetical protein